MSASQQHGLEIERRLKQEFQRRNTHWLPSRLALEPEHTARFDVPGYVDPYGRGIPTSIKSAKLRHGHALICLADATRIADLANFAITRLLVALYEQAGDRKIFREVREYLLTGEEWKRLTGGAPADVLSAFSADLKRKSPEQARAAGKEWQRRMSEQFPDALMRWNPKVDSKNQRRLQCSVHLRDIEAVIEDRSRIKVFGAPRDPPGYVRPPWLRPVSRHMWGNGMRFPVALPSAARRRQTAEPESLLIPAPTLPVVTKARPRR